MSPRSERGLLLVFLAAILALAWYKPLESEALHQADAGLKRALVTFGTARVLNAGLSLVQGINIAAEPGGVGVNFAPGQILRPVNELVGQFAELMLAASVVFGVMHVLIVISSNWLMSVILALAAIGWVWARWRGLESRARLGKVLFVLLLARFAVPLVTVGSDILFRAFMESDYSASQDAIARNADEIVTTSPGLGDAKGAGGLIDRIKGWLPSNIDIGARIEKLKQIAGQLTEHIVRLIVVFLMQTLVLPLLLFWVLYRAVKAMIEPSAAHR